jgi:hypothetical protein
MKKAIARAAFAFMSLATISAHAQSTTPAVPSAPNQPQQTAPVVSPSTSVMGQTHADGQQMTNARSQYKPERMRNAKKLMTDKKADRQEMKMQKKADKAGSM